MYELLKKMKVPIKDYQICFFHNNKKIIIPSNDRLGGRKSYRGFAWKNILSRLRVENSLISASRVRIIRTEKVLSYGHSAFLLTLVDREPLQSFEKSVSLSRLGLKRKLNFFQCSRQVYLTYPRNRNRIFFQVKSRQNFFPGEVEKGLFSTRSRDRTYFSLLAKEIL